MLPQICLGKYLLLATKQADYTVHFAEGAAGKKKKSLNKKRLSCKIWQGVVRGLLRLLRDLGEQVISSVLISEIFFLMIIKAVLKYPDI